LGWPAFGRRREFQQPSQPHILTAEVWTFKIDREVEVIYADRLNSIELLRDQLERAVSSGETDGGFPVVREDQGQLKLLGYIGVNELEHALSKPCSSSHPRYILEFEPWQAALRITQPAWYTSSQLNSRTN
jgi:hypothetical protein